MKFRKYQCPSNSNPFKRDSSKEESTSYCQFSNRQFFQCFCKTICTTTKRLDMSGSSVYKKIRRRFQDMDIPALLLFLKTNQDVVYVNLANNNISDIGFMNLLDHMLLYKNIEVLDLQNNDIADEGIKYLLKIGRLLEIKNLNLRANKFDVKASINMALFLLKNTYVVSLNVADVNQTASSLIYFMMVLSSDQEIYNKTLKSLDISRPNPGWMYQFDSTHFADVIGLMLKCNTYLKAIYLQKYNFSCHDIEKMMYNAKYNNTLSLLDLSNNNIGDHGVEHITSWLLKRPALRALILSRNIITDHGARSLSFTIPFSKLLALDVSYNKIENDGMVDILNTLKKTPMLRQLKIFGNCIGHPAAKIVRRMLTFQLLQQENIDVRPYRVDHKWYFARYEGDNCRKEYYDIPYGLFFTEPPAPVKKTRLNRKYYKYTFSKIAEMKMQHSAVTIISRMLSEIHVDDCKCCYCLKCEAPHFDEQCRDADHPDNCNCCKCKVDSSSDICVDESVIDRIVPVLDVMKNISYILKRVDSEIQDKIIRWINIDEDILEEDLKAIADKSTSEDTTSCTCSWVQLSISSLRNYLEKGSSKNLLIVPNSYLACPNPVVEVSSSSLQCCAHDW